MRITAIIFYLSGVFTTVISTAQPRFLIDGNGDQYIRVQTLDGMDTGIDFIRALSIRPNWRLVNDGGAGDFIFRVNDLDDFVSLGTEVMRLTDDEMVGISSPDPLSKLHIQNGLTASLSKHGSLLIGDVTDMNLVFDEDEILARENGIASKLFIQRHGGHTAMQTGGGNVGIGISQLSLPSSKLQVENGKSADLIENGFLMLGGLGGENLVVDENNIQARDNGSASDFFLQPSSGNTGVGSTAGDQPVSTLQVFTGNQVALSGSHGLLMLGREPSENMVFDEDDIQARAGVDPVSLHLQRFGENVGIGMQSGNPQARLHIEGGNEALLNSDGYLMAGKKNGINLVMDNEKIQTRNNGGVTPLTLQRDGGNLIVTPLGDLNKVGIGTLVPEEKLHVESNEWQIMLNNESTFNKWYMGASDVNWSVNSENHFVISSTGASGTGLIFLDRMNQTMGVGTMNVPNGYKVAVEGNVVCEEVLVALEMDWPDYVFSEDYELTPLEILEMEIKELGHLPGIPSAEEVKKEGIHLGNMNARLLKKIEELTLYVIKLKAQNERIESELKKLRHVISDEK